MMVLCNDDATIEYGRRRSELPSPLLDMEYDDSSIEYDGRRSGLPSAPLDMEHGNNITEE